MTEQDKESRYGPVVGEFNSVSHPDQIYEVRHKDGRLSCQCPGWRFRKTCKHVGYIEANPAEFYGLATAQAERVLVAPRPVVKRTPWPLVSAVKRPIRLITFDD